MKKSRKRLLKKIYIGLFLAMITLPWIVWGGVRIFAPSVYAEQSDLSREKRNKNELNLKELFKSGQNLSAFQNTVKKFIKVCKKKNEIKVF